MILGLLYKIVDTYEKTQESVYIFKYQYKLPEEKCMTHTENTKQFFTLELETSAEVTTDLLPSVTLNSQKITLISLMEKTQTCSIIIKL